LASQDAVVFALEEALELLDAALAVLLLGHSERAAEMVRERHEVRALADSGRSGGGSGSST
jgi:hypothetical protein